ncbi:MAG: hypothetical protein ACW9W3_03335 [Candidatus Nitrosopumilus sp. bin_68KS]
MGLFGKKKETEKKRVMTVPYVLDDGMKWIYCTGCRQYVVGKHIKHYKKRIRVIRGNDDYETTGIYRKGRHKTKLHLLQSGFS